jgi:hypothetical protein
MAERVWLWFNQYEDVLSSTDLLALVAPKLREQPSNWKWMVLAAHSGLQGALVCAITDSSGTNILSKRSAKALLRWFDTFEGERPREHLDDFLALLKKYRKEYPCHGTIRQLKHLYKLHFEFRNNFTHFVPAYWSIEIAMFPPIIGSALDAIEAAMRQQRVAVNLDQKMQDRLASNLATTRAVLACMKA